jgi:osmotically-inducible protein OsmY
MPSRQGTSQAEIDTTQMIKQSIAADRALSSASQVKVCTAGTIVTLHGTIDTEADRAAVEDLAWGTADVREVDDRIVVKR